MSDAIINNSAWITPAENTRSRHERRVLDKLSVMTLEMMVLFARDLRKHWPQHDSGLCCSRQGTDLFHDVCYLVRVDIARPTSRGEAL